jgi:replication-associated recombination protein RarA
MSQNYQSQDLWSRATSANGYPFDELRSVLQKSIRRGWLEEAVLAAYEFFVSGAEAEELLWRRLEIIATEDVGFGLIEAPAILEALNQQRLRMVDRGDRWMYSVHAVRLLATAKKDNSTMELACWAQFVVEAPRWVATLRTGGRKGQNWKTNSTRHRPRGASIWTIYT